MLIILVQQCLSGPVHITQCAIRIASSHFNDGDNDDDDQNDDDDSAISCDVDTKTTYKEPLNVDNAAHRLSHVILLLLLLLLLL